MMFSIITHDVNEDHWNYAVECIDGESELQRELELIKENIITHQDDYSTLLDVEVVTVDENGDVIDFDYYNWSDNSDYPSFLQQRMEEVE